MTIAYILLLCALVLAALGTLNPLISILRLKKAQVIGWLSGVIVCLVIDNRLGALAIALPAFIWVLGMRWWGGVWRSLLGALLGGLFASALLWLQLTPEPGVLAGIAAAMACGIISRYRRVWLSAGFFCMPAAWFLMQYLYRVSGALLYVEPWLWIDAAVACACATALLCGAFEAARERRRLVSY